MNILFICRSNVCRSPLAEALLKKKFADNRLNGEVRSAGFESFHINELPDDNIVSLAASHGVEVSGRARLFTKGDFIRFDRIYAMDALGYNDAMEMAESGEEKEKVDYLMNVIVPGKNRIIPDPYHSGVTDCESLFTLLDEITDKLIEEIKASE